MKKAIIAIIIVFALGAAGIFCYDYFMKNEEIPELDLVMAEYGHVYKKVSGSGKVGVVDSNSIFLETSQRVLKVLVKEGDIVKKGDVLITYDIESDIKDIERQIREAQLNLQNARLNSESILTPASGNELIQYESDVLTAQKNIEDTKSEIENLNIKIEAQQIKLDDAKSIMDRNKELLSAGGVSQKTYDDSVVTYNLYESTMKDLLTQKSQKEATLATRNEQLNNSSKKLENAKNKLSDDSTSIKYQIQLNNIELYELNIEKLNDDLDKLTAKSVAPIGGSVAAVNITDGGTASSSNALIIISDTSNIVAKYDLSEYDAPLVKEGMRVQMAVSGLPDKIYTGKVSKISAEAVEKEDSSDNEVIVPIEISIENADESIKIGYSIDVDIFAAERDNVICLPVQSVVYTDEEIYCFVKTELGYEKRVLETGLYGDKHIEITSGVSQGDKVVLNPWEVK